MQAQNDENDEEKEPHVIELEVEVEASSYEEAKEEIRDDFNPHVDGVVGEIHQIVNVLTSDEYNERKRKGNDW